MWLSYNFFFIFCDQWLKLCECFTGYYCYFSCESLRFYQLPSFKLSFLQFVPPFLTSSLLIQCCLSFCFLCFKEITTPFCYAKLLAVNFSINSSYKIFCIVMEIAHGVVLQTPDVHSVEDA